MAKTPSTAMEFFLQAADMQRDYLFRVRISKGPNALKDLEVPDTEFFISTGNTPDYSAETTDLGFRGITVTIPMKDNSPKIFNGKLRYVPNSKVGNYFKRWKEVVTNPRTGYMQSHKEIIGELILEALSTDGENVTLRATMMGAYPSKLGGGSYDSAGSGFIEKDLEMRFVDWTEDEFDKASAEDAGITA